MNNYDESKTMYSGFSRYEDGKGQELSEDTSVHSSYKIGDSILNLYEVRSEPYMGGMGSVVKVHHTTWNVDLAMKQPQASFASETKKEIFTRECEAWINLGLHPNIVTCYYVRNIEGVPSIFSEWMDNGSLKDLIQSKQLYQGSEKEIIIKIIDILIQSACGIAFAHSKNLIHQDIKPANILCGKDGAIKIADFGLANIKKLAFSYESGIAGATTLAENGGYTLLYCSPEQMQGHPVSMRTDIWSWAVTALEMFTGGCKWTSGPLAGYAFSDYLQNSVISVPGEIRELLCQCFKENENDRPHDFGNIIVALNKVYLKLTGDMYDLDNLSASNQSVEALNNKALSYIDLGKPDEAERIWQEALSINPLNTEANYNNALHRWRNGKITEEEALSVLDELYKRTGSLEAAECQAMILCESGQYSAARAIFDRVGIPYPDSIIENVQRQDVLSIVKEITIADGVIYPFDGIAYDNSSKTMLVCANSNPCVCSFYRIGENESELHLEHAFHQREDEKRIITFTLVNHGKNILMRRQDGSLDIHDARSYEFVDRLCDGVPGETIFSITANREGTYIVINYSTKQDGKIKFLHKVWNVERREILGILESMTFTCFFSDDDVLMMPYGIAYKIEKDGSIKSIQDVRISVGGYRHNYHAEIKGFRFSSYDSVLYVVNKYTKQCLVGRKMEEDDLMPRAICISEDNERVFIHGSNKLLVANFFGKNYLADWKLSRIVSITDAREQKKKFRVLYDFAKSYYDAGDYKKALEKIDEASLVPGYSNDAKLMELNREVGKFCRKNGFRNIQFSVKQFKSQYKQFSKWSDHGEYVLDISRRYIKIEEDKLLDLITGKTVRVDDKYYDTFLIRYGMSLKAYVESKGNQFEAIRELMKSRYDLVTVYKDHKPQMEWVENDRDVSWHNEIDSKEERMITIQYSGIITVWDLESGSKIRSIPNNIVHGPVCMSNDGHYLALVDRYSIVVWDLNNGEKIMLDEKALAELGIKAPYSVSPTFVDETLIIYNQRGCIALWDLATQKPKVNVSTRGFEQYGYCEMCSISNDQRYAIVSRNGYLAVIELDGGTVSEYTPFGDLHLPEAPCFSFTADKNILVSIGDKDQKLNEMHYINWKYEFPGWADWDEAAKPYVNEYVRRKGACTKTDVDELIHVLQNHDLGWIRQSGIEKKIEEITGKPIDMNNKKISDCGDKKLAAKTAGLDDKKLETQIRQFLQEKETNKQKQKEEKQIADMKKWYRTMGVCEYCGGKFKGLFTQKCKECGRKKSY